jgi:hypothetical protein
VALGRQALVNGDAAPAVGSCPVCGAARRSALHLTVLGDVDVEYFKCDACGFLGTEAPHWLDRAYDDAITPIDTGVAARSLDVTQVCVRLFGDRRPPPRVVDIGAGYGLLVRMLRDVGLDARWSDPHCENVLARGFEFEPGMAADVAVAVEVLEHDPDPVGFLRRTMGSTGASTVLVTTEVLPEPVPAADWWYFVPSTGQHLSFFERRTLHEVAARAELHVRSHRNIHLFSMQPYPATVFRVAVSRLGPAIGWVRGRRLESYTDRDGGLR